VVKKPTQGIFLLIFGVELLHKTLFYMKKSFRPRLRGQKKQNFEFWNKNENRVLIIGDLHCPFDLDSYVDHCIKAYNDFNCNAVVFIGDVIDSHYSSFHETDPDGLGGGQELELAINRLAKYYKAFPDAYVTIGNHDRIIMRKAFSSAIPKIWIKEYNDVLNTPNWKWVDRVVIDGVQYVHGEGGTARTKCRADMQSSVQGHLHTQLYCETYVGQNFRIFGMQVGCGIDFNQYAFAYAKRGKKPAIGCGVVINGQYGITIPMEL
jgi:metallophosphoesterase superfamily enzyme